MAIATASTEQPPVDLSDLELDGAELIAERAATRTNGNGNAAAHWTAQQIDKLRKLLRIGEGAAWAVGDHTLTLVPMGRPKVTTGALSRLRELADHAGCEPATLKRARQVAHAWPPESRATGLAMSVHGAWCEGGPDSAFDRRKWLLDLAAAHGGTISADDVREARGLKRCRELRDPVRSVCGRIDRAHALLDSFPVSRSMDGHSARHILLRSVAHARQIADRLEQLAAG